MASDYEIHNVKINKKYLDRWLDEGRPPDWCVEESPSTPLIPSINKDVHYSRECLITHLADV